jgi:carboxyl-terminal processing protease
MKPLVSSIALLGLAGVVSLGGAWLLRSTAVGVDHRTASLGESVGRSVGLLGGYDLRRLPLVNATLHEVEVRYVDIDRVQWDAMFDAALQSVERHVATTLFRREPGSDLLHVQVGFHHTVVELPAVGSRRTLEAALREVAGLVAEHVRERDIRVDEGIDPWASVEYAMINGMLSTLDPHSRLLPPEDSREMDLENSGEFGGLGITIVERNSRLTIEYPLPDTPAADAGLQADDRIVRINGESTINMTLQESVRRLRGPVGSSVRLTIERGTEPEPFDVTIVRDRIKMNPVEGDLLDGGVGIISIKSFHANVAADLDTTLAALAARAPGGKLSGLILDLRGNPGGYLSQAVAVSNKFLEAGLIVRTRGRGRDDDTELARPTRTEPRYPIAVLLDASSASASEIVAGALRNNDRAITVGERSFGKGSVQNLEGFFDGSKLKLTIAQYYTPPGDQSIQSVGIPADIEILPTVAEPGVGEGPPTALVHYRERVRRESDLERGLARQIEEIEPPVYSVRMLRAPGQRRRGPTLEHLRADPQVQLAREVLVAARGRSRRAEVLESAAPVIERARRASESEVVDALGRIGFDWSAGPSAGAASLDVRLDLGPDGELVAGADETIWLEVKNRGPEPIHRLVAVSRSESEILNGREFVLGRVAPGATVRFPQQIALTEGYPTERTPVTFTFRDGDGVTVADWSTHLPVRGRELPRLAWQWRLVDRGDGDGRAAVGESIGIELTVENLGLGPTSEAFARIRNRVGKRVDISDGTLEIGQLRTRAGEPCVTLGAAAPGAAEADPEAEVESGPEPAPDCARRLLPGESWTGELTVRIKETGSYELDLTVGDARAFDYAAVMRQNFYSTFTNTETLRFSADTPLGDSQRQAPPDVRISRAPPLKSERGTVVVSGQVTDDHGLAHVVVYHNDRKVFFADGGQDLRALPFTADLRLKPGLNTVVVIATDVDGLARTRSVVTSYEPVADATSVDAQGSDTP